MVALYCDEHKLHSFEHFSLERITSLHQRYQDLCRRHTWLSGNNRLSPIKRDFWNSLVNKMSHYPRPDCCFVRMSGCCSFFRRSQHELPSERTQVSPNPTVPSAMAYQIT